MTHAHTTDIAITRRATPAAVPADLAALPFSAPLSDHMFLAEWTDGVWSQARVQPYAPIGPALITSTVQYAVSAFEGLKAQRGPDGVVRLFRPHENARRLHRSAERLAMAPVPEALFLDALQTLLRVDDAWVPAHRQGALYIRPVLCSVDPSVRVKPAERFVFAIITFPFAAYYAAPVRAWVADRFVRAWPGGTGDVKAAGNYAGGLAADLEARAAGCDTVLWLDGPTRRHLEECGVMNVFAVIGGVVVTPALSGSILPGVTRDSALRLLRDLGHAVQERPVTLQELVEAAANGALTECFGTGTAATVSHIASIHHGADVIALPGGGVGPVATTLRERLVDIGSGAAPDPYGWIVPVAPEVQR